MNAATSDGDMMSEDIAAVLQLCGGTDIPCVRILHFNFFNVFNKIFFFQVANKNTLTNNLAFWEAIMVRRTALDQLKDGLCQHELLRAVQYYPDSFESLFTFKGYLTADEVLSCIDLSRLNPPLCTKLNTYICTASHQG